MPTKHTKHNDPYPETLESQYSLERLPVESQEAKDHGSLDELV